VRVFEPVNIDKHIALSTTSREATAPVNAADYATRNFQPVTRPAADPEQNALVQRRFPLYLLFAPLDGLHWTTDDSGINPDMFLLFAEHMVC
jgi:hypothetical protein